MNGSELIEPFVLSVKEEELAELKCRLRMTRWPEAAPVPGWQQGVPLGEMQRLRDYWLNTYDWRRCERMLNGFGQFRTVIDGTAIHFIHARSPEPTALPIVITHGWPGSVIEFCKVIDPLVNPAAHGGDARDAFHVIVPSLPGFGFSDNPPSIDWGDQRIARAWLTLLRRLGYRRFVAQGGDWGAAVTVELAALEAPELLGIHLNMAIVLPDKNDMDNLTEKERQLLADLANFVRDGRGYSEQQRTKPQTLGYALAESPMGQAAWIYDKYRDWSDCDGDPLNSFSLDEMLDNIMLYWLPNHGASAARLYATVQPEAWERSGTTGFRPLSLPVGVSVYPKEMYRTSRRWAEKRYSQLIYWNEPERGGHFAAFEEPASFVNEMRNCFRPLR